MKKILITTLLLMLLTLSIASAADVVTARKGMNAPTMVVKEVRNNREPTTFVSSPIHIGETREDLAWHTYIAAYSKIMDSANKGDLKIVAKKNAQGWTYFDTEAI